MGVEDAAGTGKQTLFRFAAADHQLLLLFFGGFGEKGLSDLFGGEPHDGADFFFGQRFGFGAAFHAFVPDVSDVFHGVP